jgi:LmbE family N-acetylglucosaminyl deacetylase
MRRLRLSAHPGSPLQLLCLGAHCDDIEIGCGATLLRLLGESADVHVGWVVFSSTEERRREAQSSAEQFLAGARSRTILIEEYRDGFFPYDAARIKESFERLKGRFNPDIVFTHRRQDAHQDHRTICELTWNTFRDQLILEYEIPKYDGDMGQPNVYVELDAPLCAHKIRLILESFASQRSKHWFDEQLFWGLLRLRGMECGASSRYAEAFFGNKLVL